MSKPKMCFSFLLLLCCQLHPPITISIAAATDKYTPTEDLAINCGSSGNTSSQNDQRTWIGDDPPPTLLTIVHPGGDAPSSRAAEEMDPRLLISYPAPPRVSFSTARISRNQFSYIFPVTAGPKFLRLHFYRASYDGGFDLSSGLFTVIANDHTLLSNFNVSLAVENGFKTTQAFISMEFCIWVAGDDRSGEINITFAPSPSPTTPTAYAFINGIEIVSMPAHLYYSADGDPGAVLADGFLRVDNSMALETMFRLNAGGLSIEPQNDTGMHRDWLNDADGYMTEFVPPIRSSSTIEFTNQTPSYVAPEELYQTARTMGKSDKKNRSLTWTLPVDLGFEYLVRLHFCEILDSYKRDDRVFQISIAGQILEEEADVLVWTKKKGVPVYKDYAVWFTGDEGSSSSSSDRERRRYLNVSLYPNLKKSLKIDAILNGLEVFKISSRNGSLAAPIQISKSATPPILPSDSTDRRSGRHNRTVSAAAVAGSAGGATLVLFSLLGLYVLIIRRRKPTVGRAGTGLPSRLCRQFSVAEILAATNNLDRALIVGRGGFGDVYKGHIDGGATAVAIKRLKRESKQGFREFRTEIEMLSQLRHLHLVSLIGYCNDGGEMMLVYAYVSRGTLRDHLYANRHHRTPRPDNPNPPLPWKRRLAICLGAARGLHHLHRGAKQTIIHRDVKTTNILLDDKWVAKVSDFGLSKVGPSVGTGSAHVSTLVKGSFGYLDPEYFRRQQLTEKSDVYSFGVVLLEVLCGRPPVDQSLPRDQVSLALWAQINCGRGTLHQIVDPHLDGQIATAECLTKFAEIAMSCIRDEGAERPLMEHVVGGLELVLQLQEEADHEGIKRADLYHPVLDDDGGDDERVLLGRGGDGHESEWVVTPSSSSSARGDSALLAGTSTTVGDSETLVSGEVAVFSEIINPNAR